MTGSKIDFEGKRKAEELLQKAYLIIWCSENREGIDLLNAYAKNSIIPEDIPVILCLRKSDRIKVSAANLTENTKNIICTIEISVLTDEGIEELIHSIKNSINDGIPATAIPVTAREQAVLSTSITIISELLDFPLSIDNVEIFNEELRLAVRKIGEITGSELELEVLSQLFQDFCIGK